MTTTLPESAPLYPHVRDRRMGHGYFRRDFTSAKPVWRMTARGDGGEYFVDVWNTSRSTRKRLAQRLNFNPVYLMTPA